VKNLVGNPGFESDLHGWDTADGTEQTLTRAQIGHTGSWSALVQCMSGTRTIILNDAPNWVKKSRKRTYIGSMWVRSDKPGANLYLRLREYKGTKMLREKLVGVELSRQWQQVKAKLKPRKPGKSTIDYSAAIYSADRSTSFNADDAQLSVKKNKKKNK
jgi:hypothetical protein